MEADMSKEKFNNRQNKLEDVDSLQMVGLQNKDAAWEKLHARMSEKPRNKKVVWYWLAAACLLIALIVPFFISHKTNTDVVQQVTNKKDEKNVVVKKEQSPANNIVVENNTLQPKEHTNQNVVIKTPEQPVSIIDTATVLPLVTNNNNDLQIQNIIIPATVDTSSIAGAPKPAAKKLKVVHLNELGEPIEVPAELAHNADLHLFQLKLAQQAIYNTSTIASNYQPVISLKPKNSN